MSEFITVLLSLRLEFAIKINIYFLITHFNYTASGAMTAMAYVAAGEIPALPMAQTKNDQDTLSWSPACLSPSILCRFPLTANS